VSTTSRV